MSEMPKKPHKNLSSVAIVGARGYSGLELARLLLKHPTANLSACFATDSAWALSDYLPEQAAASVPVLEMSHLFSSAHKFKTVFLATPVEVSAELTPKLIAAGINVIDLSGAFRLKSGTAAERSQKYKKWYSLDHPCPDQLADAEYGLIPWVGPLKKSAAQARLISNPGCYATSVLMAILPLLKEKLIEIDSLVIDSKSGTSGAGRKADESILFTEVDGECLPYKVGKHQHLPEMIEAAQELTGLTIDPFFTTHLLPVRRGIISGIYARLTSGVTDVSVIDQAFQKYYGEYPLVKFGAFSSDGKKSARQASLKQVVGSTRTHIHYQLSGNKLFVFSLIDNLLKGAASQAVENFNRLEDLPVATALIEQEGVL